MFNKIWQLEERGFKIVTGCERGVILFDERFNGYRLVDTEGRLIKETDFLDQCEEMLQLTPREQTINILLSRYDYKCSWDWASKEVDDRIQLQGA